jgi:hypothetical protein
MITEETSDDFEYHYVLFECETEKYELGWSMFKKIFANWRKPDLKFENWQITDFDDHLRSNIYIEGDFDLKRERNE